MFHDSTSRDVSRLHIALEPFDPLRGLDELELGGSESIDNRELGDEAPPRAFRLCVHEGVSQPRTESTHPLSRAWSVQTTTMGGGLALPQRF